MEQIMDIYVITSNHKANPITHWYAKTVEGNHVVAEITLKEKSFVVTGMNYSEHATLQEARDHIQLMLDAKVIN
jgi:hypothetical protein